MKVLVAVKRVVDYNVKVRVKSDGTDVDIANVSLRRRGQSERILSVRKGPFLKVDLGDGNSGVLRRVRHAASAKLSFFVA